ncbi:MarR family winged helix-turn-helix transcriptional regulator [Haloferula sargassicola]
MAPLSGASKTKHVAWRMLLTTHGLLVRRIEERLTEAGTIPLDWQDVLMALHEAPGGKLRPSDVAEFVLLSRAGISRRVERMCARGLIQREQHPSDRRSVFLSLTEKGRRTLFDFWPVYRAAIEETFTAALTAEKADTLSAILHGVLEKVGSDHHQTIYPAGITEEPQVGAG